MTTRVAISYHTDSDADRAAALCEALGRDGVVAQRLTYLTLAGFSLPDGPAGGRLRKDGWVDHFANLLEKSVGMISIRSEPSRSSETEPGRGMWIEQQLTKQLRGRLEGFIRTIEVPVQTVGEGAVPVFLWAAEQACVLTPWLKEREQGAPLTLVRFDPQEVNIKHPYDNHELQFSVQYGHSHRSWFFISVLDLYDRVWHCRNCLATSDVWLASESRPQCSVQPVNTLVVVTNSSTWHAWSFG